MQDKIHTFKSYDDVITFGKHAGKTVGWLLYSDVEYAIWMHNNCRNARIGRNLLNKFYIKKEMPEGAFISSAYGDFESRYKQFTDFSKKKKHK